MGSGRQPAGKDKMLSWLRCFPHDGTAAMDSDDDHHPHIRQGPPPPAARPAAARTITSSFSFRKKPAAAVDPDSAAERRKRFTRTNTTLPDRRRHSSVSASDGGASDDYNHSVVSARSFSFAELAAATGGFSDDNLLGSGGFGRVYRGRLAATGAGGEGTAVAVKRLDRTGHQGDREFLVEVLFLSSLLLRHPNLVGLLGYCADGSHRLLVYRLMPLGSLHDHLFVPSSGAALPWRVRIQIARGAARGLEFLHEKASPAVIYRDLKPSNILLDSGFRARLSDFGLAKLAGNNGDGDDGDRRMGTHGYCAPEYVRSGRLTVKSDVYSFGVVLLELITGRHAVDEEGSLVGWAAPLLAGERHDELLDPRLQQGEAVNGRELKQAVAVAAMCLQEEDALRPNMSDVVMALSFLTGAGEDDDKQQQVASRRRRLI